MRVSRFPVIVVVLLTLSFATASLFGQSLTTGSISGTVLDPTNAVISNATVNLKSLDTGATASTVSSDSGTYNFGLLKPGSYQVSIKQAGFGELDMSVQVQVGQTTKADLVLAVSKGAEVVEVSGTAPLVNTDASMNTPFTPQEVQQLPSAGGDITNIANSSPGVVMNPNVGSGSGYGNFTINGLPGTSNMFTVNGENDMDPYFNINNSGASNMTLGQNEVSEATVITNPYSGNYGQLAGAQVTYVTKSGTNQFHGNAQYWWNGRYVNANNWMNNNAGEARPFSNANQWAASVGGPIIKNKTFFFLDYEGLRFILPNGTTVDMPTAAFQSALMQNISTPSSPNYQPNEIQAFQTFFDLYNNAIGGRSVTPVAPSAGDTCSGLTFPAFVTGFTPGTTPCEQTFRKNVNAFGKEWILSGRVDQRIGDNDNVFFRYKSDHGLQPTTLDFIDSNFNAISNQPSWDAQAQETHIFGPNSTNSFMATVSHYVAQFQQNHQLAASTFPYGIIYSGGSVNFTDFNQLYSFPQGRNITQYQFIDDFSLTRGVHTLKFGANFRRYDVSDHNFFFNSPGVYFGYSDAGLQEMADGHAYQYRQSLNVASNVPVALWGLGVYAQDDWRVNQKLKVTLALRVEHSSNPVCNTGCLSNFKGPASSLATFQAAAAGQDPGEVPYSSDIAYGLKKAFPATDNLNWSPRVGFSWDPRGDGKTVISGGVGLFYDTTAAGLLDDLLLNPPSSVQLRVRGTPGVGVLAFDTTPTGAAYAFQQSAQAFSINDSFNTTYANLQAMGVTFNPPAVTAMVGTMHSPQWQEWNLSVQRQLSRTSLVSINYVGNHGIRIPYTNSWANAWDPGIYYVGMPLFPGIASGGAPVPNYANVNEVQSGAVSNYNGLTFSYRKQFSHWISAHLNYTWSHNLDESSNGGVFTYGDSNQSQDNPASLRAVNYGNTDYDVRHNFNGDFVLNPEFHLNGGWKWLANGWQLSGKAFWRSGLPFSVVDNNWDGAIQNGGATIYAQPILPGVAPGLGSCGAGNATANPGDSTRSCLNPNAFYNSGAAPAGTTSWYASWPTQRRNQYHGPRYFDMDLNLFKNFRIAERVNAAIGIQAFNAFNHPNFGNPDAGLSDPGFGQISSMVGTPTSPYGAFLGFDSSPRVVQLSAKVTF